MAALSSSVGNELALLEEMITALSSKPSEGKALFFANCAGVIGLSKRQQDIKKIIQLACIDNTSASAWWQSACLKGLAKAMTVKSLSNNMEAEKSLLISKFSTNEVPELRSAALELLAVMGPPQNEIFIKNLATAKKVVDYKQAPILYRVDALKLIAMNKNAADTSITEKIISDTTESESLQLAAMHTYKVLSPGAACASILRNWKNLSKNVRDVAIDIFLTSPGNMNLLLDAVQKGTVQTASVSWPQKVELMNNENPQVRSRARKLLAPEIESRENVFKKYQPALAIKGDTARGFVVYKNVCGSCHKAGGKFGNNFGPDLGSISNRDAASIMADILNPNRSIAVTYEMWTLTKRNGEKLSGIKSAETSSAITLKQLSGMETTVARGEIKWLEASDISSMPVGLESSISINDMASLLAFLRRSN